MATLKTHNIAGVVYTLECIEALVADSFVMTQTRPRSDTEIVYEFDDKFEAEAVYAGFVGAAILRQNNRICHNHSQ